MKKVLAAVAVGALLIAGQAAAAQNAAVARVGDRVGAKADASSEFAGVPVAFIAASVVLIAVLVASNDDSDSD
jgi:hypothetical protein